MPPGAPARTSRRPRGHAEASTSSRCPAETAVFGARVGERERLSRPRCACVPRAGSRSRGRAGTRGRKMALQGKGGGRDGGSPQERRALFEYRPGCRSSPGVCRGCRCLASWTGGWAQCAACSADPLENHKHEQTPLCPFPACPPCVAPLRTVITSWFKIDDRLKVSTFKIQKFLWVGRLGQGLRSGVCRTDLCFRSALQVGRAASRSSHSPSRRTRSQRGRAQPIVFRG